MRTIKKSYLWGLYAKEYSIGDHSPQIENGPVVDMKVVQIDRFNFINTSIKLVPCSDLLEDQVHNETSALMFELGQRVRVSWL